MVILGILGIVAAIVTMRLPEPSQKSLSDVEFGELLEPQLIKKKENKGEKTFKNVFIKLFYLN